MTTEQQVAAGLKKIRGGAGSVRVSLSSPVPRYPHKIAYRQARDLGMAVKVRVIGSDMWMFPKYEGIQ
jgi:hypothetical protein